MITLAVTLLRLYLARSRQLGVPLGDERLAFVNESIASLHEELLETHGVHKRYGPIHALRDVNLALPRGSIGLLGPNGAGKSTLLDRKSVV